MCPVGHPCEREVVLHKGKDVRWNALTAFPTICVQNNNYEPRLSPSRQAGRREEFGKKLDSGRIPNVLKTARHCLPHHLQPVQGLS